MAERRMFALKIIDSDAFLDMPDSTQNLYFHLSMRADDDGFISNPKKIMRMIGASDDDMKILLSKRFLLAFDTGIVVIKHWRLHNYIAKDRYHETIYKEEKDKLFIKANGAYTDHPIDVHIPYTGCIQNDDPGKVSLGKSSLVKVSKGKESIGEKEPTFSLKNELNPNTQDATARVEELRQYWNTKGIKPIKATMVMNPRDLLPTLSVCDNDMIKKSMDNYYGIGKSPGHDLFPDNYSFEGFIQNGIDRFCDDSDPWEKCKKKKNDLKVLERTAMIDIPEV
jgi:hypothetical protein